MGITGQENDGLHMRFVSSQPFVSKSGRPIRNMDNPAFRKTVFCDDVLHDEVVRMSVNAQMAGGLQAVSDNLRQEAVNAAIAGDRVNRAVWRIGKPLSVFDDAVSRIFPKNECKNAVDATVVFKNE